MININKDILRVARLKAAMWEGGNVERLISKAILAYTDTTKSQPKRDVELYIGDKTIVVKNVPHLPVKSEVGDLTPRENLILTALLEEVIEEEYPSKTEIEFRDLLK
jgi:hypothetical protein